ncbi:MAG: UPF0175 family protein [Anaerolineae bacterium]|jgi:predicted HTH domain antitoxin|nr:UPF0175 family protein [Anaerolineae bacterium]
MSAVHVLEVSQDILDSARLTPADLKVEMAVHLYAQRRLSAGKARELAGLTLWEFRQVLASRRIPPHYDEAELDEDVATLREMGRL